MFVSKGFHFGGNLEEFHHGLVASKNNNSYIMNELSANSLANASALSNIDGLTLQVVSFLVCDGQMVNIRIMNSDQKTVRYLYGTL